MQGYHSEQNRRWWAEGKDGVVRLEFRPPPRPPWPLDSRPQAMESPPDPAVSERLVPRRFTAEYDLRIIEEADYCTEFG